MYLYTSDECKNGQHGDCAGERDVPTDPEACGGGACTCGCHTVADRRIERFGRRLRNGSTP